MLKIKICMRSIILLLSISFTLGANSAFSSGLGCSWKDTTIDRCLDVATNGSGVKQQYAQSIMAKFYLKGKIIKRSKAKFIEWSLKASNAGYTPSQYRLGMFYSKKSDLDVKKSFHFLEMAAEGNNINALEKLGSYYLKGKKYPHALGIEKDDIKAEEYYSKANKLMKLMKLKLSKSSREPSKYLKKKADKIARISKVLEKRNMGKINTVKPNIDTPQEHNDFISRGETWGIAERTNRQLFFNASTGSPAYFVKDKTKAYLTISNNTKALEFVKETHDEIHYKQFGGLSEWMDGRIVIINKSNNSIISQREKKYEPKLYVTKYTFTEMTKDEISEAILRADKSLAIDMKIRHEYSDKRLSDSSIKNMPTYSLKEKIALTKNHIKLLGNTIASAKASYQKQVNSAVQYNPSNSQKIKNSYRLGYNLQVEPNVKSIKQYRSNLKKLKKELAKRRR